MHVIATAGHVDHGKSTLVRALTGMEPDRLAEERRRGMTIDLGYAWTTLPTGEELAFVDVPGHQRFIATMLAGLGPAAAVLFVVAADEGWSRQSDEHLAAVDALGVQHGVLAITRSDICDPRAAAVDAVARVRATSLGHVESVAVSGATGAGLAELRSALSRMLRRLPPPDPAAPVRFWVDRAFNVRGSGTVVTGTLSAGTVTVGSRLTLRNRGVTVRGIHSLGVARHSIAPVSRVALNLRAVAVDEVSRGNVLLTPDRFQLTAVVDARLEVRERLPAELILHTGTAAVPVHVRALDARFARLTLHRELPLRAGDRAVLRDPGRHAVAAGVLILDADPPELRRRGAARLRAAALADASIPPDAELEVTRRGVVTRQHLDRLGIDTSALTDTGGWLVGPDRFSDWARRLPLVVADWAARHPLEPAIPHATLGRLLGIPDDTLLAQVIREAGLNGSDGRVGAGLPSLGGAEAGLAVLLARLTERPFDAPERDELRALGLGRREVAAAVRAGRLLQLADGIVLRPDAPEHAIGVLTGIAAPFTLSAARQALGTTRRVAVPLLEHLDTLNVTVRIGTSTRSMREKPNYTE